MKLAALTFKKSRNNLRIQRGLTLIESLLVLAVAALIALGAYGASRFASADVNANDLGRSTVTLVSQLKRTLGTTGSYASVNEATINSLSLTPPGWSNDGTDLKDNYGNKVTINGVAGSFALQFTGLGAGDCAKVVSQFVGIANKVTIGGDAAAAAGLAAGTNVYKSTDGTISAGSLSTGCAEASRKIAIQVS